MLIDALAFIVIGVLTGVLGLVPSFDLPGGFETAGSGLGSVVSAANEWFPVVTVGLCIAAVIAVRLFLLIWSLVVFIYDRFPLKAT